ncbi:MAG: hypothetical protein EOM91_11335 [Sphingobacteriia bacterium]|nr:hypothetical protein [Sphingobacteriia bacterium]NCC38191.1 hypothetical protein [Gammaproteobacteria bacterium]
MDASVTALLVDGLWLMVTGLTIVFVFLLMLVGLLDLMSKAVARWGPQEPQPEAVAQALPPTGDDARLTAVITAAIQQYRARHRA